MRVYISGPSGVGKTAATNELSRMGYPAFDTDDVPGLARLELLATGQPVEWPSDGLIDWKRYGWCLQERVLNQLLNKNETIFLSGICHNQPDFYDKFDVLIVLTTGIREYERRMRTRPYRGTNDNEANIQQRIEKYPVIIERLLGHGFTPVDDSGTPSETAKRIVRLSNEK